MKGRESQGKEGKGGEGVGKGGEEEKIREGGKE